MRSPNRTHERQSFFKYVSAATAAIILDRRSLRWSSPILFNDPFDVPRELSFGITPDDLVQAIACRVAALIENPPTNTSHLEPRLRVLIDTVKNGVSSELVRELIADLKEFSASLRPTGKSMDALRELWRSWLPDHRILCLSDSAFHAAMWYHYADRYRGVVLEFRCVDELDSAWLAARPVEYPISKPTIYTADGWAELLSMPVESAIQAILHTATYTKSPDWSYESEWRVASYKRPDDDGPFTDYGFHPRELSGVFLGPMIAPFERELLASAAMRFPDAKTWDVSIGMSREFDIREACA